MDKHVWSFSTVGGVKRVNIENGKDLLALEHLDQKLWTALSCPVNGLEIDSKTLELIDKEKDGQIRAPEILAAIKWLGNRIKNPDDLLKEEAKLPLSSINDSNPEGALLLASAKIILKNTGKEGQDFITLEETGNLHAIFADTLFNGDGIITPDAASTPELKQFISEVIEYAGSVCDRSGKAGINSQILDTFKVEAQTYLNWKNQESTEAIVLFPFGENTQAVSQAVVRLKDKIEDYFLRVRLAEFDPDVTAALNVLTTQVEHIASDNLISHTGKIAGMPVAKIQPGKALNLIKGVNPLWESDLRLIYENGKSTLLGGSGSMDEPAWNKLLKAVEPFQNWTSAKPAFSGELLGYDRVKQILEGNHWQEALALINKDLDVKKESEDIIQVDQLVRYYRDLYTLVKNFVTFYDFYSPNALAIFQAGTLYIDQRSLDLCIRVSDMARHDLLVAASGMYLIYCNCINKTTGEKMVIVAALTNGDIDNLTVGRNALFYDRQGNDWDAMVIKIVENPISIRQAFFSPYRRVSRFIEKQITKFAAEEDNKVHMQTTQKIEEFPVKTDAPPPTPPPPFDVGKYVGIFAAIGLALGAIGTALASVVSGFLGLVWWKMPIALTGLLLVISGPSMIMAFLKLRQRNLAPILDANGWAINARAIVNIPFGNTLTHLAILPKGSKINLNDPFMQKRTPLWMYIFYMSLTLGAILYILWKFGFLKTHLF